MRPARLAALALIVSIAPTFAIAADWPQWGGGPTRNPVSLERGLPLNIDFWDIPGRGKVIKGAGGNSWSASPGDRVVLPPVVADGLVWVCTNAKDPRDPKLKSSDWDGGVLACLRESNGELLWLHRTPRLSGKGVARDEDFSGSALGSAPLVEGDRLWYVNNRNEVVCFDLAPLKSGKGKPTELWKFDMRKNLGVHPHLPLMQFGFAASVAGYKDRLYVVTHNGVDETYTRVPKPDAPSLVCLEKATGRVLWKDNSPGKGILDCQISSPLVATIKGKVQVIVGQGDGWLRAFDAATGNLIWKCDLNAKDATFEFGGAGDRNYVVATPILYDDHVYVATGQHLECGPGPATLYCIDPTKEGDVSRDLDARLKKGKPNPNSAVVWYTPREVPSDAPRIEFGKKKRDLLRETRDFYFCRSIAGCVAHDGLVYTADVLGCLYCFDTQTGRLWWVDTLDQDSVHGQLLWADGKVLVVTQGGGLFVFAHGKEKKLLAKFELEDYCPAGPVFANGTLYIATRYAVHAIRDKR